MQSKGSLEREAQNALKRAASIKERPPTPASQFHGQMPRAGRSHDLPSAAPPVPQTVRLRASKGNRACWNWLQGKKSKDLPEYNPDITLFSTLLSWKGTILPLVLRKPSYYVLVCWHGTLVGLKKHAGGDCHADGNVTVSDCTSWQEDWLEVNYSMLSVPTTMLVFFLVFYGGQCCAPLMLPRAPHATLHPVWPSVDAHPASSHGVPRGSDTRFFTMYSHCVGIAGSIMCWVAMVKLHLADDANVRWNAVRFMLAAAHVEYYGLSGNQLTSEEWLVVKGRDLLTDEEVNTIKKYKGFKPFLPIYWALCEVRAQLTSQAKVTKAATSRLRAQSLSGRSRVESGGSVFDFVGGNDNAGVDEMMIGTHPVSIATACATEGSCVHTPIATPLCAGFHRLRVGRVLQDRLRAARPLLADRKPAQAACPVGVFPSAQPDVLPRPLLVWLRPCGHGRMAHHGIGAGGRLLDLHGHEGARRVHGRPIR